MKKMKARQALAVVMSLIVLMTSIVSPSMTVLAETAANKPQSITLSTKSKVTMYVGMSKKIKVRKVTPNNSSKKVTYESSTPEVVKISGSGTMKALKEGKAVITVTSASNKEVSKKVNVTVKNLVKIKTYNKMVIPLDKKKKTRTLSRTSKVKASCLKISSNRRKVATVSKGGVLTGKKVGTAKITIKGTTGLVKGAKQVITLYVAKKSVKSVAMDRTSITLKPSETVKLTTTVTPKNAANVVVFTTSDKDVANVDQNGQVTAIKEGTAKITAATVDGNKKTVCVVTVSKGNNEKSSEATTENTSSEATTENGNGESTTGNENGEATTDVPGEVTSVTLNKTSVTIDYGAAVVLKATVFPENAVDKTITWKSGNTRVATVADTGVVVGAGEGTTSITATTANGKSASCTITVVERDVDSLFVVPYVSTYYFNPKPSVNEDIKIPIYMTDSNQSEYLNNDTTGKLDLIYEIDGEEKVINDLPLGDYTVNFGKLSEGTHTFSLQTLDKRTGMKSHKLYNELWVVNPETYEISESQTYHMTEADLEKYQIHNDNSTDEMALITTRDGLTKMFADLQEVGYRKCILLPGTYRINGKKARNTCISIPSNFTVDMNQSTFKLDTITDESEGCIVRMYDTYDAHLTNGTLEGDRFERQELGLEKGYQGEPINTLLMSGGKYSSISNLTIKNTTGHTVGTGYIWGPNLTMTDFTKTAIIDGKEVEREGCSTSSFMDLTKIIDWDPNEDYMYVGHGEGYRGIKGNSSVVYVHFYDENKNFLETVTGYQFRKMKIVDGAKYARVTLLGDFPSSYASDSISIFAKHLGDYYEIKNIDFVDTRTTAMAPSACNNLLIEGCTYTRAGNSITPCAVDFEDGWEECQDVYYRNNKVLVNSGTATVIDDAGYNHVYENLEEHRTVVRDRVLGAVFRNVNDVKSTLHWTFGTKKLTAFGRIYDNTCGNINFALSDRTFSVPAKYKVKNCTINASYLSSVPNRVVYENCTFPTFNGSAATFKNCTIQPTSYLGSELYFYDCTFKNLAGDGEPVNFRFNVPADADRVFENCTFEGKTAFLNNNSFHSGVFRNCEFDDLSMTVGVDTVQSSILFEKCKIHSTAENFIYVGPFAYSLNYMNLIFKGCEITHTGKNLINLYAKTNNNSQILFEESTVNKEEGALLAGYNIKGAPEGTSLDIIFRNSTVNKELAVDENVKPEQIRIVYEEENNEE